MPIAVANFERGQKALATMKARFDPAKLSAEDRLSYRLFEYQAERAAKAHPFRRNEYIFDQMNGAQSQMPAFLINIHRVASKSDAQAYVSRLQGIGPQIDGLIAEAKVARGHGRDAAQMGLPVRHRRCAQRHQGRAVRRWRSLDAARRPHQEGRGARYSRGGKGRADRGGQAGAADQRQAGL